MPSSVIKTHPSVFYCSPVYSLLVQTSWQVQASGAEARLPVVTGANKGRTEESIQRGELGTMETVQTESHKEASKGAGKTQRRVQRQMKGTWDWRGRHTRGAGVSKTQSLKGAKDSAAPAGLYSHRRPEEGS